MKKTLITLLALSGLAMGGTTTTISSHGSLTTITTSDKHSLTLTSTINIDDLKAIVSGTSTNVALLGLTGKSNDVSISVSSDGSNQTLRLDNTKAGNAISGAGNAFTWSNATNQSVSNSSLNSYFTLEGAVAGAITLGYNTANTPGVTDETKGTHVVFSVLYSDGNILTLYGFRSGFYYTGTHIVSVSYDSDLLNTPSIVTNTSSSNAAVSKAGLIESNIAALKTIPEPTTATLSLLALCGLAARRRRK